MANEYLKRVPTTVGNRRTFTISFWSKLSIALQNQKMYSTSTGAGTSSASFFLMTESSGVLHAGSYYSTGGGWSADVQTTPALRDTSAWYHIVCAIDTTQSTASNRIKLYVNNVLQPKASGTDPTLNFQYDVNNTVAQYINSAGMDGTNGFTANTSDFFLIDGYALDPSYFGKSDSHKNNQWVAKHPTAILANLVSTIGGLGTNGCYLPMSQHSVSANDVSGNYTLARKTSAGDVSGDVPGMTLKKSFAFTNSNSTTALQTTGNLAASSVISSSEDFTIEFWIKCHGNAVTNERIITNKNNDSDACYDMFIAANGRSIQDFAATVNYGITLRDSQWDHVAICRQSGTGRYYLNGVQQSSGANSKTYGNSGFKLGIGGTASDNGLGAAYGLSNSIIAAVKIRKGVCSYPNGSSFTPSTIFINDSGTVFLLQDSINYTIGTDVSGITNNGFTAVNFPDTTRVVKDSLTNNFATMNSSAGFDGTQSKGNLIQNGMNDCLATMGFKSGKFYWEHKILTYAGSGNVLHFGVKNGDYNSGVNGMLTLPGIHYRNDGQLLRYSGNSCSSWSGADIQSGGTTTGVGDVLGIAVDTVSSPASVTFYKNGTSIYTYTFTYGYTEYYMIPYVRHNSGCSSEQNFGQGTFVTSNSGAGYSDANGKGKFQYPPPTGFLALCEDNITETENTASKSPTSYFKTITWTGDGATSRAINTVGFSPDLVLAKCRNNTYQWMLMDSVRGGNKVLHTNSNTVEDVNFTYGYLTSFDANGFTMQAGSTSIENLNNNSYNYVAWCWGGAGSTTISGTTNHGMAYTTKYNNASGLSIMSYTGSGTANHQIPHGLDKTPSFTILKCRTSGSTDFWLYYQNNNYARNRFTTDLGYVDGLNGIVHSSSYNTITHNDVTGNGASNTYMMYTWKQVDGYSKIGKWVGNGSTNGPFVYTGFRPAFVMFKRIDGSGNDWRLVDSTRDTINPATKALYPNTALTNEGVNANDSIDLLSNGFKIRSSADASNLSNGQYVFVAFAEQPFDFANAR